MPGRSVAIVLPPREAFSPDGAGAVAMVAERLARASSWTTRVLGRAVDRPFDGFHPVGRLPYGLAVALAVRSLGPDLVEVHNRPGLARALSRWHPRVGLVLHNDPCGMPGMRTHAARLRLGGRLAGVAAVSSWVAARSVPARAVVLPNGLDLPPTRATRERLVVFAGRVVADKGADVFVDAMARVPHWRAVMVGADRFGPDSPDTPFLRRLRPRAAAAGVEMLGWRPHAEVVALLSVASIAVVPSVWPEPFGLAALEAMASGAALIHTGVGGLSEVVGDAGVLVPPGDEAALAAAILALVRDPVRRDAVAAAGLSRARDFGMAATAARVDAWRADLLRGLPAGARKPIWRVTE